MRKLFQIRDQIGETVLGPIMVEKVAGPAVRHFHSLLANKETMPGKYPEHYVLLYLGEQDEDTGEITPAIRMPEVVATGEAWIAAQQPKTEG